MIYWFRSGSEGCCLHHVRYYTGNSFRESDKKVILTGITPRGLGDISNLNLYGSQVYSGQFFTHQNTLPPLAYSCQCAVNVAVSAISPSCLTPGVNIYQWIVCCLTKFIIPPHCTAPNTTSTQTLTNMLLY